MIKRQSKILNLMHASTLSLNYVVNSDRLFIQKLWKENIGMYKEEMMTNNVQIR